VAAGTRALNLALRFLLELCALAALAYGGWAAGGGWPVELGLAIALPLAAAVYWGALIAPRARWRLPDPWRAVAELVLWIPAAAALALAGHPLLAAVFAVVTAANLALLAILGQRTTA
jgi:hypothetical protein